MKKSMGNVARKLSHVLGVCMLTVLFLFTCDTTVKAGYYTDEETGIRYAYNEDATTSEEQIATVYSYSGDATEVTIPESITTVEGITYKVIGIGDMDYMPIAEEYPDFAEEIELASGFYENETITTVNYEAPENIRFIGTCAFQDCSALAGEVPIPSGLKYLGDSAFRNCDGLNSMHIPDGAVSIGDNTFYSCNSISENSIPGTITSIGSGAFQYCESLSGSFRIPSTMTEIPEYMLYGCKSITGIELHENITKIGKCAFGYCSSLAGTFKVPEKVTEIPAGMLCAYSQEKNKSLTAIELHDGITKIGTDAFANNTGITSMTIPLKVTRIEAGTFSGCTGLQTIELHDNIVYFGNRAFADCSKLTGSIEVPDEMTEIPYRLFYWCTGLDNIILPEHISDVGKEAFYKCESWAGDLSSLELTSVGESAFGYCKLLSGLPSFSDEMTEIPQAAFGNCTSLSGELVIPGNVKSIGVAAFSGCTGITSLVLEDGIETIGKQAFLSCDGLKSSVIYIPESVSSVGALAFRGGDYTREWLFNATIFYPYGKYYEGYDKTVGIVSYKEQEDGTLALYLDRRFMEYGTQGYNYIDPVEIPEKIYGKTVSSLTIPDFDWPDWFEEYDYYFVVDEFNVVDETCYFNDWDRIAVGSHSRNCAICGEADTEAHSYPNGTSACSGCGHIPFTLMSNLSQKAMQTGYVSGPVCSAKAVCKLAGENLTYQWYENNKAIPGAMALTYTVPTGKTAGTYTYTCKVSNGDYSAISTGVTFTVYKPEVVDGITLVDPSLETPEAGDYIKSTDGKSIYKVSVSNGTYEVEYSRPASKNLTEIVIPDTVIIGGVTYDVTCIADNAFKNCRKLKTLKIGNKVKKIGAKAFYGCKSLTKVTGGKALLTIGKSAFQGCSKLKIVSITSKKLKTIGAKTFYGCKKLTKITLKTTKLKKNSVGKNALKKTSSKLVIKVPKKKVSVYKKYFTGKGNKNVKVK